MDCSSKRIINEIKILDHGNLISYTHEDLLKYHGYEMLGGVALAYQLMVFAFPKLCKIPMERGYFSFYSGIGENGRGVIDALEMVTRVKSFGKLFLDKEYSMDKAGPLAPNGGRYYFELTYKDTTLCVALRDGLLAEEFISCSKFAYACKTKNRPMTEAETNTLFQLRKELGENLMQMSPEELFYVYEK